MAAWFNATFTTVSDISLPAYTTDSGHTFIEWLTEGGTGTPPIVANFGGLGIAYPGQAGAQIYRSSVIAPSADVSVPFSIRVDSAGAFVYAGVGARMSASGSTAGAGYMVQLVRNASTTTHTWQIHRLGTGGGLLAGGSVSAGTITNGTAISGDFEVAGTGATVTLKLRIGGSLVLSVTDTAAERVTTAGYVGLAFNAQSIGQGVFFNSLAGDTPAVVNPPAPAPAPSFTAVSRRMVPLMATSALFGVPPFAAPAPPPPLAPPSLSVDPYIIGTPRVGVQSNGAVGIYTGGAIATNTFGWSIDGVVIAGAEGIGYTPLTAHEAKALRFLHTASNGAGTSGPNASAPKTVLAAAGAPSQTPFSIVRGATTLGPWKDAISALNVAQSNDHLVIESGGPYVPVNEIDQPPDYPSTWALYSGSQGIQIQNLTIRSSIPGVPAVFDLRARSLRAVGVGGSVTAFELGSSTRNIIIQDIHVKGYRNSNSHQNAFCVANSGYNQGDPPAKTTFIRCFLQDWTNGVITTHNANLDLEYIDTVTQDCTGSDLTHGLYASVIKSVTARGSAWIQTVALRNGGSVDPIAGHLFKGRPRTITIDGCYFFAGFGGARVLDISNGGDLIVRGSILCKGPADSWGHENMMIGFGAEQTPFYNETSPNRNPIGVPGDGSYWTFIHDGRTHSVVVEQCTLWQDQVTYSINMPPIQVWPITNSDDSMATVVKTIRNNIVASQGGADFVALYPNNSAVLRSAIAPATGVYSGAPIPGSPAVNDAAFAFGGNFQPAIARTDTFRGGRVVTSAPSWLQAAPTMTWTDVPGSNVGTVMLDAGGGVDALGFNVPAFPVDVAGTFADYQRRDSFGGKTYNAVTKEFANHGGGHSATTENSLTIIRLKESPDIIVASRGDTLAQRNADYQATVLSPYHSAGPTKSPIVPHPYRNCNWIGTDLVHVGLGACSPSDYHPEYNGVVSFRVVAAWPRSAGHDVGGNGQWHPANTYPNLPEDQSNLGLADQLAVTELDNSGVYFCYGNGGKLRRLNADKTWTTITTYELGWNYKSCGTIVPVGTQRSLVYMTHDFGAGYGDANGWYTVIIDLATKAGAAITINGITRASFGGTAGSYLRAVQWVQSKGAYYMLMAQSTGDVLVKLVPTDATHLVLNATIQTLAGTPTMSLNTWRPMSYDPEWDVLFIDNGLLVPVKFIKLS